MILPGEALIRRFLLYVLPKGLMRIRHYGFLANRCRQEKLAKIRQLLGESADKKIVAVDKKEINWPCPKCHQGQMKMQWMLLVIQRTTIMIPADG